MVAAAAAVVVAAAVALAIIHYCEQIKPVSNFLPVFHIPGSLSACDAFLNAFEGKGLKPEALCPCASSTETMTVALRR